ncbi:MAG: AraC family transcriptional regulator [Prevotella sp.]
MSVTFRHMICAFLTAVCGLAAMAQPVCRVTHLDNLTGTAQWHVSQIIQDRNGVMWFSTWTGLNRYDGYRFENFKSGYGDGVDMPSDRISDMLLDDDGNILCHVDYGKVFKFDVNSCRFSATTLDWEEEYQKKHSLRRGVGERLTRRVDRYKDCQGQEWLVCKDKYGVEWTIGGDGSVSYRTSGSERPTLFYAPGSVMKDLHFCTIDNVGDVWFRSVFGIYRLEFRQATYTTLAQESPTQVRCLFTDKQQRLWVANKEDATVRLYDRDSHLLGYLGRDGQLHSRHTAFGAPVYGMAQGTDGTLWMGSKPEGLFRIRNMAGGRFAIEQFTHHEDDSRSLSHDAVYSIAIDRLGRLWVATFDGGLNCVEHPEADKPTFLHKDNGLRLPKDAGLRVRHILITANDVLLASTTQGLIVADIAGSDCRQITFRRHVKDATRGASLSSNEVMSAMEDSRRRLFVSTESGGVNMLVSDNVLADTLVFRHFNRQTGLSSDVALSVVEDGDKLLIVSNDQLIFLSPDNNAAESYNHYFWQEPLRFSDAIPVKLPDGQWLFGLYNGAITTRPANLQKSTFAPPIALTGVSLAGGAVNHAVNGVDTIVMPPSVRDITIHFATLDYRVGEVSYAYKIDDKGGWKDIQTNHSVTFFNISPGTHLLHIRSTNRDGLWVDNVRTLTIIAKPAFVETVWAKLLLLIVIGLTTWGILLTRRHIVTLKRQRKEIHEAYLSLLNDGIQTEAQRTKIKCPSVPLPEIDKQRMVTKEVAKHLRPEDEAFMQRAIKFIEANISNPDLRIGDMAEATATSLSGVSRKMKSLMGVTPLDFIREARIRKACQMLKDGYSVADTANRCGFSDSKYFRKCFKEAMNMTPTEYKEQTK